MSGKRKDSGDKDTGQNDQKKPRPQNANLRPRPPWPKGVSANPGGRPKGRSLIGAMRDLADKPASSILKKLTPDDLSKLTVAEFLAIQAYIHAAKGRAPYFETIIERMHGKVPLRIEQKHLPGEQGGPSPEVADAMLGAGLAVDGDDGGPES